MPICEEIFKHPFSRAYWRAALNDFRKPRTLAFAALMVAVCIALAYIPVIPLTDGLEVTWGFLGRSVCALVGGPFTALAFGFVEDTLSFLLHPTGPYFPGYTLTTMLGTFFYAIFLYRSKVTVFRIFLAKLTANVLNIFLGSLWSAILYGKGYLYRMSTSLVKNTLMLPVQTLMLALLFAALIPILSRMRMIPAECGGRLGIK